MPADPCTISDVAWHLLVIVFTGAAVVAAYLRSASKWSDLARGLLSVAIGLSAGACVGLLDGGPLGSLLVSGAAGACAPWVPGTLRTVVRRRTGAE